MIDFTLLSGAGVAWLVAAASAATLALYLLKPHKRRVLVPFVALWDAVLAPKPTAALFSRLRRLWSILLALTIVALLALARGGPEWSTRGGRHVVVLVDAGAHMQARDVTPTRFAAALVQARRLIDQRGAGDELLIAQLDESVTPLSPLSSDTRVLLRALAELRATSAATQLDPGLRFAIDVLRDRAQPELILISDGVADSTLALIAEARQRGIAMHQIRLGARSRNVRLAALAARRYPSDPSEAEVMVEVENGGEAPATTTVTLSSEGRVLDAETFELAAHEKRTRFHRHVGGAQATLEAQLRPAHPSDDDLPSDDRARTTLPARPRKHVLLVSTGNRYLEAALLSDETVTLDRVAPTEYHSARSYDAVIFDGFEPTNPPEVAALHLGIPSGSTLPFVTEGSIERPFFETTVSDRLLRFCALRDVNIKRAARLHLEPGDRVLASSGKAALLVRGERAGQRMLALAFDVRESDLPLRAAWPVLLSHALDELTQSDADLSALDAPWRSSAGASASLAPRTLLPEQAALAASPGTLVAPIAREPWLLLLALATLIVLFEWWSYQRRWTV